VGESRPNHDVFHELSMRLGFTAEGTELGEVHCEATVTPEVRPGTVSLPKGLWAKSTFNGATANALVPDSLTDIAGGACFNDARVQVALLARH
jgi:anaerobic selenocysteine-containing dehydrogenase